MGGCATRGIFSLLHRMYDTARTCSSGEKPRSPPEALTSVATAAAMARTRDLFQLAPWPAGMGNMVPSTIFPFAPHAWLICPGVGHEGLQESLAGSSKDYEGGHVGFCCVVLCCVCVFFKCVMSRKCACVYDVRMRSNGEHVELCSKLLTRSIWNALRHKPCTLVLAASGMRQRWPWHTGSGLL